MRMNQKLFVLANGKEPFEKQELTNRVVELYYMDDFQEIYDQYCPKGKFVVFASEDGVNYRLFIEKGFYEVMKDLYCARVNDIWLGFWDKCDAATKKSNFKILMPIAVVALVAILLVTTLIKNQGAAMGTNLGLLAVFLIAIFFVNKKTKKEINELNESSLQEIQKYLGKDHFEELLEAQKKYTEDFFDRKAKEAEELYASEHPEDALESTDETSETSETVETVEEIEEVKEETNSDVTESLTVNEEVSTEETKESE